MAAEGDKKLDEWLEQLAKEMAQCPACAHYVCNVCAICRHNDHFRRARRWDENSKDETLNKYR